MAKRHSNGTDFISQIRRCEELLLARSGSDAFYETLKILFAKAKYESGSPGFLSFSNAQKLLSKHSPTVGLFVEGPTTFTSPPEVIESCLKVFGNQRITDVGFETIDAAFEGMTSRFSKSEKGQYFTPRSVVSFCIEVLRPDSSSTFCDPACGSGAFLKATYDFLDGKASSTLFGFDISKRTLNAAAFISYFACKNSFSLRHCDSLAKNKSLFSSNDSDSITALRSSSLNIQNGFDVIATNPPFAGDVGETYSSEYILGRNKRCRIERDILFLERCVDLLKENGRCAIVLPDNKFSSERYTFVRNWLLTTCRVLAVVSLHEFTFRPHTSQKACILFFQKSKPADTPILFYKSNKPGKRSNGSPSLPNGQSDCDLDEIRRDILSKWKL
jgi:type I restriction enzyme M protein